MVLYKNIRLYREKNGWTLKQVAQMIGIDYANLSRIERGVIKGVSIETVIKLSQLFEITLDELVFKELEK